MTKQEILEELRNLVAHLDNTAQQCLDLIQEQDVDDIDYELEDLMDNVLNEVTNYQERMEYI